MAEVPPSVRVPVPDELRPYFVLETEPGSEPPCSRFGGWWASVWLSAIPCVQLGRGDGHAVSRSLALEDEGDANRRRALLEHASFFVTTRETSLDLAREVGAATIWVPDGDPRVEESPAALADIPPDRLRVVRSPTAFRRDVPMQSLQQAFEDFAPGIVRRDLGESIRCRERLRPYLLGDTVGTGAGRVADLGHGGCKILPSAVGVDYFRFDAGDWIGDVRDLHFFGDQSFDAVYSSHCLEDLWDPRQALEEWTRILAVDGFLSLYLPLRDFYPNVGTPGANPGHKDDYVPEDVEGFVRELGNLEVVRSERFEDEDSFEIIARKKAGRSFYSIDRPSSNPVVSVLIVGEVGDQPEIEARALRTTIASAEASLTDVAHETLVLLRQRPNADGLAAIRELAALFPSVRIIEDLAPRPYPARIARLAREVRSEHTIVLESGSLVLEDGLSRLLTTARDHDGPVHARVVDVAGQRIERKDAILTALCLETRLVAGIESTPYCTPVFWRALLADSRVKESSGTVVGSGLIRRPERGRTNSQFAFDTSLLERGVPAVGHEPARILIAMLRTFGDAVLATSTVEAVAARWPEARIDVVTEADHAWLFETNPAVARVLATTATSEVANEEVALHRALQQADYDRYILLSPRLDNTPYFDAGDGMRLAEYYARLAGVPEAGRDAPRIHLTETALGDARRIRESLGLTLDYAVVHTRAGWDAKSPTEAQCRAIVDALATHGLAAVIVGGPGELVAHPRALNLAGMLSAELSAAMIAEARVFVGPDSGCLHVASAFGVPSLALYAGSHPWVAPPLASSSVSLLASTSCPRPCGRSCSEGSCGVHGITEDELTTALERVLGGTDAGVLELRTRCADAPVTWIPGPHGPQRCTGTLARSETVDLATQQPRRLTRATTLAERVVVDVDLAALADVQSMLAAARSTTGEAVHFGPALETTLGSMTRRGQLDTMITLASHAVAAHETDLAFSWLERAALTIRAAVHGENGRARPAFKAWLDDVFMLLVTVPTSPAVSQSGIAQARTALDHALAFWDENIDEPPCRQGILHLEPRVTEASTDVTRRRLADHLAAIDEADLGFVDLRRCAAMLRRVGRHERARDLVAARKAKCVDPELRAALAWDHALAILEDAARVDDLRRDLEETIEYGATAGHRVLARRLLSALRTRTREMQLT